MDQVYELTGPEAISPRDQAETIGAVLGVAVRVVEVGRDVAQAKMLERMPIAVAEATLDVLGAPSEREQRVSPAIQSILGRPAHSYYEWVESASAAFR